MPPRRGAHCRKPSLLPYYVASNATVQDQRDRERRRSRDGHEQRRALERNWQQRNNPCCKICDDYLLMNYA
eukprot:5652865-Pleurochrysis_carterae.AAC.6